MKHQESFESPPILVEVVRLNHMGDSKIVLRTGNKSCDLGVFLPQGVCFREKELRQHSWIWDDQIKCIIFDSEKLRADPRNIFLVLHELGHVQAEQSYTPQQTEAHRLARRNAPILDIKWSSEEESIKRNERDAWANALYTSRRLRDEYGIDVSKLFKRKSDLMRFLRERSLYSYERNFVSPPTKSFLFGESEPSKRFKKKEIK